MDDDLCKYYYDIFLEKKDNFEKLQAEYDFFPEPVELVDGEDMKPLKPGKAALGIKLNQARLEMLAARTEYERIKTIVEYEKKA